ncbi:MAG: glycosyltransferase family 9 protein [candidate division Zixibacteria bacterium]|nr:glycosyltransferase family 9 protein [candidate division Zixibacteria bacterium]
MNKLIEIQSGEKILISRSDKLGDLVLALPFIETMKERYPECQIDVMASLYASPILEGNPRIDKIVRVQNDQLVTNKLYKKDLLHRLRLAKYNTVIALFPERHVCSLFYKAQIPHRLGTAGRFHSVYFNHLLFHSRKANRKHEYEYNLDFLKFFRPGATISTPMVYPKEKEFKNARRILKNAGINKPFVVLHPGTGGSAENWPMEKFMSLYSTLSRAGLQVVLSGSDKEGEMIDELAFRKSIEVRKITGETDLRTLAAVLSLASTVVANSTGPLHLAVAVGTKVVGLYPAREVMSPLRWGPLGKGHQVIVPPTSCSCPPKACRCMETITVDQVADKVRTVFKARQQHQPV